MKSKRDRRAYYQSHKEIFKARNLANKHPCMDCGKPVSPTALRCKKCGNKPPLHRGIAHHLWRGGRALCNGYEHIKMPEHPRANINGYVREHILIWEEAHGKPVPKGWIVHHLNGITTDNRPQNLVAMPNHKHCIILQAKAKRIQELEALLKNQLHLL